MQIIWYANTCFKIISSGVTIITNPFSPKDLGFKNPRITSEIVIFSSEEEIKEKKDFSGHLVLSNPGEYEIKNIFIYGIPHFEGKNLKTIYLLNLENIKICFFGEVFKNLTDKEIEKLYEVDIVILPLFDKNLIDQTIKMINKIQPSIIIPVYKKEENELLPFLKKFSLKKIEKLEKLKIKKNEILKEKKKLVILKPNL